MKQPVEEIEAGKLEFGTDSDIFGNFVRNQGKVNNKKSSVIFVDEAMLFCPYSLRRFCLRYNTKSCFENFDKCDYSLEVNA